MPGYDRTGPRGDGHMTGRGMGYCRPGAQQPEPSVAGQPVFGLGRGGLPRGGGRGFGFGGGYGSSRGFARRNWLGRADPGYTPQEYEPRSTPQQESRLDKIIGALEKIVTALTEKK